MDSEKYLISRGWEENKHGEWRNAGVGEFGWLHFDDAFKYQLQCDAERLDAVMAENNALNALVSNIAMLIHSHPAGDLQGWGEIQVVLTEYQNSDVALRAAQAEGK